MEEAQHLAEETPSTAAPSSENQKYRAESKEGKLPVMEIFGPTIQGEGAMIGVKTMFIRFGGCDYRCEKCDSMHAVEPNAVKANATWMKPVELAEQVYLKSQGSNTSWVTLSGGNPALWDNILLVVDLLHYMGFKVAVETQGTIFRPWLRMCDMVTVSPKGPGMGERFDHKVFEAFMYELSRGDTPSCVKIVVFDQQDFEFAVEVDRILNDIGFIGNRFLSVGNPYPPVLQPDFTYKDHPDRALQDHDLPFYLLRCYETLLEDYLPDPRLSHWIFLPQLHVLVWGNKTGV